jgi:hypothetical protein
MTAVPIPDCITRLADSGPPRQWTRIRGEFGGVHAEDRMSSARAGRALGCGLHYRRMATWQSEDWSSGRCAVPRARRTVALRSGTDSSLPVRIRVRPSSLLAALFPFACGAAFVLRVLVGGATMTVPGGRAHTSFTGHLNYPRARRHRLPL